jgi:hypothetical protein
LVINVDYKRISEITNVQVIAKGTGVDIRHYLNRTFGRGNWRKLKGIALVRYENGEIWQAELHWYEAHGVGRRLEKVKDKLQRKV